MKKKSTKKGVGCSNQRYGSGDPDPDSHQNITDPQHWFKLARKGCWHTRRRCLLFCFKIFLKKFNFPGVSEEEAVTDFLERIKHYEVPVTS